MSRTGRRFSARRRSRDSSAIEPQKFSSSSGKTRERRRRRKRCPATASAWRGPPWRRSATARRRRGGSGLSARIKSGKRASIVVVAPAQRVVIGVGNFRCVLLMIELVVMRDGLGEAFEFGLRLGLGQIRDGARLGRGFALGATHARVPSSGSRPRRAPPRSPPNPTACARSLRAVDRDRAAAPW